MLTTSDVSLFFGTRKLFSDVNVKFTPGNCYGVIGANGAGKSTFLKILSGEIEPSTGQVIMDPELSLSVLRQDHFEYNEELVLQTVIMGNKKLIAIAKEREELYAKGELTDEDGVRAAELESAFAEMEGWEAEANAATLLNGLGLKEELHTKKLRELNDDEKVKVLLAQSLFGRPDILLLDEPTNHLDAKAIVWLENFLLNFENTVVVISHDRHFLNKVCTHMVDIDFTKVKVYVGNYDFWRESSQLAQRLLANENKKKEDKAKELEAFIQRFSANASKSKQATSRKKQLEKLTLDDIPTSSRKSPFVCFTQERPAGDILLEVKGLSKTIDGIKVLDNVTFELQKGEKCIFVGQNEIAKTTLMQILMGEMEPDAGTFRWGVTTSRSYLPKDSSSFFIGRDQDLIEWLSEYSEDKSESFIRGFLGRVLFTGEETKKKARVLSGGEKVRCMLARMMLGGANVLVFDGPTNHLDLESITALNNSLVQFPGTILFTTHDQEFAQTVASRIIELTPQGVINHQISYQEYLDA
jgi:ATPase subunit of ABC transporter with duplicated ATPase domains